MELLCTAARGSPRRAPPAPLPSPEPAFPWLSIPTSYSTRVFPLFIPGTGFWGRAGGQAVSAVYLNTQKGFSSPPPAHLGRLGLIWAVSRWKSGIYFPYWLLPLKSSSLNSHLSLCLASLAGSINSFLSQFLMLTEVSPHPRSRSFPLPFPRHEFMLANPSAFKGC